MTSAPKSAKIIDANAPTPGIEDAQGREGSPSFCGRRFQAVPISTVAPRLGDERGATPRG
jgi:hypothetical protein